MWNEAEDHLTSSNGVVPAPLKEPRSKMVMSQSSAAPHHNNMYAMPGAVFIHDLLTHFSSCRVEWRTITVFKVV